MEHVQALLNWLGGFVAQPGYPFAAAGFELTLVAIAIVAGAGWFGLLMHSKTSQRDACEVIAHYLYMIGVLAGLGSLFAANIRYTDHYALTYISGSTVSMSVNDVVGAAFGPREFVGIVAAAVLFAVGMVLRQRWNRLYWNRRKYGVSREQITRVGTTAVLACTLAMMLVLAVLMSAGEGYILTSHQPHPYYFPFVF